MRVTKVNIESSTACNASCTFCPRPSMSRKPGEMSDELFHKVVGDAKSMGIRSCSPFLYGEPFVFPRIWEWLDYLRDEGVAVSLYTNAERLDVDRLVGYDNIRYVTCSLNAATGETYGKVMRGPRFDKVKRNISDLISKARFKVRVSFIRTPDNAHEAESFRMEYPGRARIGDYGNWTGDLESVRPKNKRVPCWVLFHHITVLWDGRVVPCCMDCDAKQVLGDANRQTLGEIWDSYAWMRDKHAALDFDIPVCRECDYNVG
jgi:radical SAM protein with 4Fe4S-binding SPASM domain